MPNHRHHRCYRTGIEVPCPGVGPAPQAGTDASARAAGQVEGS
jgi:hypothetical protein